MSNTVSQTALINQQLVFTLRKVFWYDSAKLWMALLSTDCRCCCLLLPVVACCCLLLPLLPVVACCCLLLPISNRDTRDAGFILARVVATDWLCLLFSRFKSPLIHLSTWGTCNLVHRWNLSLIHMPNHQSENLCPIQYFLWRSCQDPTNMLPVRYPLNTFSFAQLFHLQFSTLFDTCKKSKIIPKITPVSSLFSWIRNFPICIDISFDVLQFPSSNYRLGRLTFLLLTAVEAWCPLDSNPRESGLVRAVGVFYYWNSK